MRDVAARLFEPYLRKKELEILKRESEQIRAALDQMLEDVKFEQQERLRALRRAGPWETDWETASREQEHLARQILRRLTRYWRMRDRLVQMEAGLPPPRGLTRLRYHPWAIAWAIAWAMVGLNILAWTWRLTAI